MLTPVLFADGKGTYFAREAKYSLQSSYAKADANGVQHLLLARVLVRSNQSLYPVLERTLPTALH